MSISRTTIRDNYAGFVYGAILSDGPLVIDRSVISGNRAKTSTGGLTIENGGASIKNSTIAGTPPDTISAGSTSRTTRSRRP